VSLQWAHANPAAPQRGTPMLPATETPKPVDPARVERMCYALVHRGPDGAGVWTAPGVGLGLATGIGMLARLRRRPRRRSGCPT